MVQRSIRINLAVVTTWLALASPAVGQQPQAAQRNAAVTGEPNGLNVVIDPRKMYPELCQPLPLSIPDSSATMMQEVGSYLISNQLNPAVQMPGMDLIAPFTALTSQTDALSIVYLRRKFAQTSSIPEAKESLRKLYKKHSCRTGIVDEFTAEEIGGNSTDGLEDSFYFAAALSAAPGTPVNSEATSLLLESVPQDKTTCEAKDLASKSLKSAKQSALRSTRRWQHASYSEACHNYLAASEAICSGKVTAADYFSAAAEREINEPLALGGAAVKVAATAITTLVGLGMRYIDLRYKNKAREESLQSKKLDVDIARNDTKSEIAENQDNFNDRAQAIAKDPTKSREQKNDEIKSAARDASREEE
jgi:hypothetical protein